MTASPLPSTPPSTIKVKAGELTPPQLSVLARSFPVPRGSTATGGWGFICSSSSMDRIQPTYRTHTHTHTKNVYTHTHIHRQECTVGSRDSLCRRRHTPGSAGLALYDTTPTLGRTKKTVGEITTTPQKKKKKT